eukprot:evm.model.scf_799.6 EVM.evm.TU.scf_799.6   scf_799:45048-50035(-)
MSRVTVAEHTAIGGLAASVEAVMMQPMLAVKNALQEGRPVPRNPLHLYRGVGVNVLTIAPITATQFGANRLAEKALMATAGDVGGGGHMLCACSAGVLSAFIASPAELVIIRQQKSGRSLGVETADLLRTHGPRVVGRGLGTCMLREGVYASGYLGLFPVLRERLDRDGYSPGVSIAASGVVSGVLAAFFSHPFDTVKTKLQAHIACRPEHATASASARTIVEQGGVRGLWRGLAPRCTRIVCAVFLLNGVKSAVVGHLEKHKAMAEDAAGEGAEVESLVFPGQAAVWRLDPACLQCGRKCDLMCSSQRCGGAMAAVLLYGLPEQMRGGSAVSHAVWHLDGRGNGPPGAHQRAGSPRPGPGQRRRRRFGMLEKKGDLVGAECRWRVTGVLGEGQFAVVFEVDDLKPALDDADARGRRCALKLEKTASTTSVLTEHRAMKKMQSAGVPRLHDFGYHDGRCFIAMERFGRNLHTHAARVASPDARVEASLCGRIGLETLESLRRLHSAGFVHRDVKPANFVAASGGRWVLIDFGLARRFVDDSGAAVAERTEGLGFKGSSTYASINAHLLRDLGRRDDLWSWFYMLVEMLTGTLPWRRVNRERLGRERAHREILSMKLDARDRPETLGREAGLPPPLCTLSRYLQNLEFGDAPDYAVLRAQLNSLVEDWGQPSATGSPGAPITTPPIPERRNGRTASAAWGSPSHPLVAFRGEASSQEASSEGPGVAEEVQEAGDGGVCASEASPGGPPSSPHTGKAAVGAPESHPESHLRATRQFGPRRELGVADDVCASGRAGIGEEDLRRRTGGASASGEFEGGDRREAHAGALDAGRDEHRTRSLRSPPPGPQSNPGGCRAADGLIGEDGRGCSSPASEGGRKRARDDGGARGAEQGSPKAARMAEPQVDRLSEVGNGDFIAGLAAWARGPDFPEEGRAARRALRGAEPMVAVGAVAWVFEELAQSATGSAAVVRMLKDSSCFLADLAKKARKRLDG